MQKKEGDCRKNYWLYRCLYSFFCLAILLSTLASCRLFKKYTNIPSDLSSYEQGFFSGRIVFHNKGKKLSGHFDIRAEALLGIRADIFGFLDTPIMSIWLKPTGALTVLFLQTRQYYKGSIADLGKLFALPLKTSVLQQVLFDTAPKGWSCSAEKPPQSCGKGKVRIQWIRKPSLRSILWQTNKDGVVQLKYLQFHSNIKEKELFDINIPSGFSPAARLPGL